MLPSPLYIERSQVQPKPLSRFFKQVVRHLKIKLMIVKVVIVDRFLTSEVIESSIACPTWFQMNVVQ